MCNKSITDLIRLVGVVAGSGGLVMSNGAFMDGIMRKDLDWSVVGLGPNLI